MTNQFCIFFEPKPIAKKRIPKPPTPLSIWIPWRNRARQLSCSGTGRGNGTSGCLGRLRTGGMEESGLWLWMFGMSFVVFFGKALLFGFMKLCFTSLKSWGFFPCFFGFCALLVLLSCSYSCCFNNSIILNLAGMAHFPLKL